MLATAEIKELIDKALKGTATDTERQRLATALADGAQLPNPDDVLTYAEWQETAGAALMPGMEEKLLAFVLGNSKREQPETTLSTARRPAVIRQWKPGRMQQWVAAAAILVVLATTAILLSVNFHTVPVRYAALEGMHKTITLPDGTKVYLNAGSSLQLTGGFEGSQRAVALTGEAFFEVTPDRERPFTVKTGDLLTTVLGTSFNIRAYPGDAGIAVSVKTGKVRVQSGHKNAKDKLLELVPGQRALYNVGSRLLIMNEVDTAAVSSWRNNRLVFEDVALGEICRALGRQYKVTFRPEDPAILHCLYSATFDRLNLEASLEKLKLLGDLRFEARDSMIYIKGEPCNP